MAQRRDGSWLLRLDGIEVSTDDLTLDDVELAEKVCQVPYTMLNPLASAKEAKALLTVLLVRHGMGEDEALQRASKTNLRQLSEAFTYQHPDLPPLAPPAEGAVPPPVAPSSAAG